MISKSVLSNSSMQPCPDSSPPHHTHQAQGLPQVSASPCCYVKVPRTPQVQIAHVSPRGSGGAQSAMGLHGLIWRPVLLHLGKDPVSCLFPASRACLSSGQAPRLHFSIFRAATVALAFLVLPATQLSLEPLSSAKGPCDSSGATQLPLATQRVTVPSSRGDVRTSLGVSFHHS